MAEKSEPSFSLKDRLFNPQKVAYLSKRVLNAHPGFPSRDFEKAVMAKLPALELKERIRHIRETLRLFLPGDYARAVDILLRALPEPCDPTLTDDDFGDFIFAPFGDFVAHYGRQKQHLAFSLEALKEITKRFSAEDAIRYFINDFPDPTLATMGRWVEDPHYHVRRLCSEGLRPKLPWSQKISLDPRRAWPLLDKLFCDSTRFVTRSVANHLNDVSKFDPDLVLNTLKAWKASGLQREEEMNYIIRHSLRTLVKRGHPKTLAFLGFSKNPGVTLGAFKISRSRVKLGQSLEFSFSLASKKNADVVVDYRIEFASASGKRRKKVFKLKILRLEKGSSVTLKKAYALKPAMTTLKIVPGKHRLAIQVNGTDLAQRDFWVV